MDPLHASLALGPLAIYLIMLGAVNLSARPTMVNGMGDVSALSIALVGFMIVGPLELFLPESVAGVFKWGVWPLLITFYFLCVSLYVLLMRPSLVIYNITAEQFRPIMAEVVDKLDKQSRVAGDSVYLPSLAVQLHMETLPALKNIQLLSSGANQNYNSWRELELELASALRQVRGAPNPYGMGLVSCGVLLLGLIFFWLNRDSNSIYAAWLDLLRLTP